MVEPALHSSARQDWGTPPGFMRWLRHNRNWVPDLDAAASPHNAKATMFFTQEDNGLDRPWFGNVWLNPPFGREVPLWMDKCAQEIEREEVRSIYALVPARTDTKWFHENVLPFAHIVYLIKGRFNFRFDEAVPGANAPFPSMLILWRKNILGATYPSITTLRLPLWARGYEDE